MQSRIASPAMLLASLIVTAGCTSIHPSLNEHVEVTVDVERVRRAIEQSGTVKIGVGDREFELALRPDNSLTPAYHVIVVTDTETTRKTIYHQGVFGLGSVIGEDGSDVFLSVHEGRLRGSIRLSDLVWFVEPSARHDPRARPTDHFAYQPSWVEPSGTCPTVAVVPPKQVASATAGQPLGNRLGIVMVADAAYRDSLSELTKNEWYHEQRVLVQHANLTFKKELGIELVAKYHVLDLRTVTAQERDSHKLLDELAVLARGLFGQLNSAANRERLGLEFVHLTSGKGMDVLGLAEMPGIYGVSKVRGRSSSWLVLYSRLVLDYQMLLTFAHEVSHNMNGAHHERDWWCVTSILGICVDAGYSLMHGGSDADQVLTYSRGKREKDRNNLARIKAHLAERHTQYLSRRAP